MTDTPDLRDHAPTEPASDLERHGDAPTGLGASDLRDQSGVNAECHACGEESGASSLDDAEAWRDRHACDTPLVDDAPQQAPAQVGPLVKPRRDERIDQTWLYPEPTDPGGA